MWRGEDQDSNLGQRSIEDQLVKVGEGWVNLESVLLAICEVANPTRYKKYPIGKNWVPSLRADMPVVREGLPLVTKSLDLFLCKQLQVLLRQFKVISDWIKCCPSFPDSAVTSRTMTAAPGARTRRKSTAQTFKMVKSTAP